MKVIYIGEIEEKSNELANFSKNNIATEIDQLKELPQKFVWKGLAKDTYVSGYNKKINKLIELNNNVCKIAEFLVTVANNYTDANSKISNAYEELLSEIKIKKHGKLQNCRYNEETIERKWLAHLHVKNIQWLQNSFLATIKLYSFIVIYMLPSKEMHIPILGHLILETPWYQEQHK